MKKYIFAVIVLCIGCVGCVSRDIVAQSLGFADKEERRGFAKKAAGFEGETPAQKELRHVHMALETKVDEIAMPIAKPNIRDRWTGLRVMLGGLILDAKLTPDRIKARCRKNLMFDSQNYASPNGEICLGMNIRDFKACLEWIKNDNNVGVVREVFAGGTGHYDCFNRAGEITTEQFETYRIQNELITDISRVRKSGITISLSYFNPRIPDEKIYLLVDAGNHKYLKALIYPHNVENTAVFDLALTTSSTTEQAMIITGNGVKISRNALMAAVNNYYSANPNFNDQSSYIEFLAAILENPSFVDEIISFNKNK